jgi:hypothetical protein
MNVEIWIEAVQFPEKDCINGIFVAVWQLPGIEDERVAEVDMMNICVQLA